MPRSPPQPSVEINRLVLLAPDGCEKVAVLETVHAPAPVTPASAAPGTLLGPDPVQMNTFEKPCSEDVSPERSDLGGSDDEEARSSEVSESCSAEEPPEERS
ncbi:hypothetical protein K435DRAFT_876046 [Dendrothele bispora CBS 962.96]|uniref:Uncharacterized protein n=1 Tax=Dendrothele bispora (strain CBS 962.96) TaxID=1314807 RepID=A0A4S8KT03_DENBC|nr:hypothetical protein K435DRAFT_876046 [Dendrothele bispora CBS 962.96]